MNGGVLPRTLHVDAPSPHVDWSAGSVRLLTDAREWPRVGRPRRAGVSSFGVSGTNAHVVLEEAPAEPVAAGARAAEAGAPGAEVVPLVLSARTPTALGARARQLAGLLERRPELDLAAVSHALVTGRAHHEHRAALPGEDRASLLDALRGLAADRPAPSVITGRATAPGLLAFLFSGGGSQRLGMGRELLERYPVFADAFDEACAELDPHLELPLREVMFAPTGSAHAARLDQIAFTQPALFALEVALHRLLGSWGVRPDVVAGHSTGELAAAHVAGVLSLPSAAVLIATRAALMQALPARGAMVAVGAGEDDVAGLVQGHEHEVGIAAVNSPGSVVLSGAEDTVVDLAARLTDRGVRVKRLRVSIASHSPLMEPMLAEFAALAHSLRYSRPSVPVVSSVTGRFAQGDDLVTADYWVRHVRRTVRFGETVTTLRQDGVGAFLEIGPGETLTSMVHENLTGAALALPLLRREHGESEGLRTALSQLYVHGHGFTMPGSVAAAAASAAATPRARVPVPTYPFEHRHYWLEIPTVSRYPAAIADTDQKTATETTAAEDSTGEAFDDKEGEKEENLAERLAPLGPDERRRELVIMIIGLAAAALRHSDVGEIDEDTGFFDIGFTSLTAVEVRNRIVGLTGLELVPMLLFDFPTPAMLAGRLDELLFPPDVSPNA